MKRIILILIAVMTVGISRGQELLTIEKCRQMAVENSRQQKIAKETTLKAGYTLRSTRANYLPNFSLSGQYLYTNNKMNKTLEGGYLPTFVPDANGNLIPNILTTTSDGTTIFNEYAYFPGMSFELEPSGSYHASLMVEQPIYMGGKIRSANKMAVIGTEMASINERLSRQNVIVNSDDAYWNCVKAKEMVQALTKYKEVVTEFYRNISNAVAVGLKHQNDALKVQVKLNEAELNLLRATNAHHLAIMNLCHVIGLPMHSDVEVESVDVEEMELPNDYTLNARPEYEIYTKQIELKKQEIKLTRSDFLPNAGVMASYGYMSGLKLNGTNMIDGMTFAALLSVNVPVFHWGEGRNKVKAAKVESHIMELQREDIAEKIELEINQLKNTLAESRMEVTLTKSSLAQAEENLKVSENQYKAGKETLADHLEAQTSWQKAWADYIEAKASLKSNEVRYLKAIGQL